MPCLPFADDRDWVIASSYIRRGRLLPPPAVPCRSDILRGRHCHFRAAPCRSERDRRRQTDPTDSPLWRDRTRRCRGTRRTAAWRSVQQIAQGRHRAVVQIGRSRPDAVERVIGIAVRLVEAAEAPGIAGIEQVLLGGEICRIGGPASRIGADIGKRTVLPRRVKRCLS